MRVAQNFVCNNNLSNTQTDTHASGGSRVFERGILLCWRVEVKLSQSWEQKKGLQFLHSLFSLYQPSIFFNENYYKTTVIEYLDVTVLLESLDLTALLEYLIWQLST